jgi:Transglycosylase SLT domain
MTDYLSIIADTEKKYGLTPGVLKRLIEVESGGNIGAISSKGAIGLTQLMPATAKELGINPSDPVQNIEGGAKYLRIGLDKFGGDYAQAIAGYNAGINHHAVVNRDFNGLPAETKKYTNKFLDFIIPTASASETPYQPQQADPNAIQWDSQPAQSQPAPQQQAIQADNQIQWDNPDPQQQAKAAQTDNGLPFLQAVGQGVFNAPGDAINYAGQMGKALIHPIDTMQGILDVGQGALRNVLPDVIPMPANAQQNAIKASAVGQDLKNRYGGWENIKQSIAQHPIQTLGDLSAVAGGIGGLAKLGGASRVADLAQTAATATDPLRMIGKSTIALTKPLASFIGVNSGVGTEAIKTAARSGFEGGEASKAFKSNMTGSVPIESVVDSAKGALQNLYKQRSDAYKTALANGVISDPTTLDFTPIRNAVDDMNNVGTYNGININPSASGVQEAINRMASQFEADKSLHNVEGFDALKRGIGNIMDATQPHTPERYVASNVYHAVSNSINDQAKGYAKVMNDYQQATQLTKELERALSLGEKASVDTTIRKLQKIMRNNVYTSYGYVSKLGNTLEKAGAKNLQANLAGQALNSWEPRSLARIGAQGGGTAGIASLLMGHPIVAAGLGAQVLMSSPRLMGMAAHGAGRFAGNVARNYDLTAPGLIPALNIILRNQQ